MSLTIHVPLARRAAFVLTLAVAAAPVAAQGAPARDGAGATTTDAFDAYVARAVRDWAVPGLAIAVVKGDGVVLAKGYGVRTLGRPDPVDANTRFAIGSTTKAMTALALGMLVDEGKVRWDEPVITYLPGFRVADPYITRELTVRDLLTHRGGLGNVDVLWGTAEYDYDEIVRRIRTLEPEYSLRSGFVYQNVMYAVAGDVVRAASGVSWEDFLRTRIFAPLGMTATEATLATVAGKPNVATPHMVIRDSVSVIENRTVDPVKAAGSVWSSVADMSRWMRFVLDSGRVNGKRLVTEATFRELLKPQTVAPSSMYPTMRVVRPHFFTYGLGWFLHDYRGQAVAMHTGSIDGMSAIIGLLPDARVGVFVLANLDHAELRHALMFRAFDLYGGAAAGGPPAVGGSATAARDWSAELRTLYGGLRDTARAEQAREAGRRVRGTRPTLPLDRFAGRYTNPTFGDVVVSGRKGALHLAYGRSDATLEHWHYDTFQARWSDVRSDPSLVTFAPDEAGGAAELRAFGLTFSRAQERR